MRMGFVGYGEGRVRRETNDTSPKFQEDLYNHIKKYDAAYIAIAALLVVLIFYALYRKFRSERRAGSSLASSLSNVSQDNTAVFNKQRDHNNTGGSKSEVQK